MNRIYEKDSYRREHTAGVTACFREKDSVYAELNESIFFPEEGGQHADTGWLQPLSESGEAVGEPVQVLDGEIRKGQVRYRVSREIAPGTRVRCTLNWEERFSRMQQHTGEHILTGVIHNRYGYENVGFHLSDDGPVTLDLSGPLTWEQAMERETEANRMVFADLLVTALYPPREELAALTYRSKIEIEGQVRLIRIGTEDAPVDLCACCAPHVSRTGEVGLIKIVSLQNYKGGVRLGILCGERALAHYRREWRRLEELARSLSTGVEQVPDAVEALRSELAETKQKLAARTEAALLGEIARLGDGPRLCFTQEVLPTQVLKHIYNTLTAGQDGFAGVFMGDDAAGYRYAAGSAARDSRELAGRMREALSAKGGGSPEMIQGKTAASRAQIEAFWETL